MANKFLIAGRGDNGRPVVVAVKAHVGAANVMPEPTCVLREAPEGNLDAGLCHV